MKSLFLLDRNNNKFKSFLFQNNTNERVTKKVETIERTTDYGEDAQGSIDNDVSNKENVTGKQEEVNKAKEDATKKGTVESMLVFLKLVIELMKMMQKEKNKKGKEDLKGKGAAKKETEGLAPPPVSNNSDINAELEPLRTQYSALSTSADTYDTSKTQTETDQKTYDDLAAKEQIIRTDVLAPFTTKKEGLETELKTLKELPEEDQKGENLKKLTEVTTELANINKQIQAVETQIKALNVPAAKKVLDASKKAETDAYNVYVEKRDKYLEGSQVAFASLLGPVGAIMNL